MDEDRELQLLAFQEAVRALAQQQSTLESVRSRAGVLLSAATISTSFFGSGALQGRLSGALPIVASALFVLVGLCVMAVYWPRRHMLFESSLLDIVAMPPAEQARPNPGGDSAATSALRSFVDEVRRHLRQNAQRLNHLFLLLSFGWVLFMAEVVVWLLHAMRR